MFSGLNKILKIILPKRLFYRALIIVAAPTIILQFIVTIVFYDSIWIKANKNITRSLVSQLQTIKNVYLNNKDNLEFFTDSYKNNFNFEIDINNNLFPSKSGERKFSPMDRSLRRELKSAFGNNNYWFNTSKFKNAVEIKIKSKEEVIEFLIPKGMVSASSVRLFVLWTTLPSILLLIIALIFLKNQTKPLVKLAKAAVAESVVVMSSATTTKPSVRGPLLTSATSALQTSRVSPCVTVSATESMRTLSE